MSPLVMTYETHYGRPSRPVATRIPDGTGTTLMPIDAVRRGDTLVIRVDLPGVDPSTVDVTVDRNELTIHAERAWETAGDEEVLVAERPHGSFTRQVVLGENLDTDRIQASYANGVLTLVVPITATAGSTKVAITSGEGESPGTAASPFPDPDPDLVGDVLME